MTNFSVVSQLRFGLSLIVSIILLLLTITLIYVGFAPVLQANIETTQIVRSRAVANNLNAYLDDLQHKLTYLSEVRGLAELPTDVQYNLLEGLVLHNRAYELLAITDAQGQMQVAFAPNVDVGLSNIVDSRLFNETYVNQTDYIGEVDISQLTGEPIVTIAVPIRNNDNQPAGVLFAEINIGQFLVILEDSQLDVPPTRSIFASFIDSTNRDPSFIYVIDDRERFIARQDQTINELIFQPVGPDLSATLTTLAPDKITRYIGLQGEPVLGTVAQVDAVPWRVVIELPEAEARQTINDIWYVSLLVLVVSGLVTVGIGSMFARQFATPLKRLTQAAQAIQAGNLDTQVSITTKNEFGVLGQTFDQMVKQLREFYSSLELQVAERTARLQTVSALNEKLSQILDSDQLLRTLTHELQTQLGYHQTAIYLLDRGKAQLTFSAGTEEFTIISLDDPINPLAEAARTGEPTRLDRAHNSDIQAQLILPILTEDQVVGLLDIQHLRPLDGNDETILLSTVNQLTISLRNAHDFAKIASALEEANAYRERYVTQVWSAPHLHRRFQLMGQHDRDGLQTPPEQVTNVSEQVRSANTPIKTVVDHSENHGQTMAVQAWPLTIDNLTVGSVQMHGLDPNRQWTEDERAIIQAVLDQVMQNAESLRLLDELQERASRERLIGVITSQLRRAPNVDTLMQIAVDELSKALNTSRTYVQIKPTGTAHDPTN